MRRSTLFRFALAPLALLAASACGDRTDPVSPGASRLSASDVRSANTRATTQTLSSGQIVKRTVTMPNDIVVTQTITPYGGWIPVDEAGMFVYFPPGAVSSDLTVTVTAHRGNKVIYSFEPHGTRFNTPVYIAQSLRYTELNTPRNKNRIVPWAGYMPDGLADVNADGTGDFAEIFDASLYGRGNDTYAFFATSHFSGYALASGRRDTSGQ